MKKAFTAWYTENGNDNSDFLGGINNEGKISEIEMPLDTAESDTTALRKIYSITPQNTEFIYYKSDAMSFGWRLSINSKTTIISIPDDGSTDESRYALLSSDFFKNDNNGYLVTGYTTIPKSNTAPYLVTTESTPKASSDDRLGIVTKVVQGLNEDDEPTTILTVNKRGTEYTLMPGDGVDFGNVKGDGVTPSGSYSISRGDVVRYVTDWNNKVTQITLVFDADAENPSGGREGYLPGREEKYYVESRYVDLDNKKNNMYELLQPNSTGDLVKGNPYSCYQYHRAYWFMSTNRVFLGYAVSSDGSTITLTTQDMSHYSTYYENGIPPGASVENDRVGVFVTDYLPMVNTNATIQYVDTSDGNVTVRSGTIADVKTFETAGKNCSRILVASHYGSALNIIIFSD